MVGDPGSKLRSGKKDSGLLREAADIYLPVSGGGSLELIRKNYGITRDKDGQDIEMIKKMLSDFGIRSFNEVSGNGMFCLIGSK